MVKPISIKPFRWPADVLRYDVWLCFRFSRSLTVVEELTAQRGIDVSYETIWCGNIKCEPLIAHV